MPVFDLAEIFEEVQGGKYAESDSPLHYEPSIEYKRKMQEH